MVYLFESKLSENKSIYIALKNIFGIGKARALIICKKSGFSNNFKVNQLSNKQISNLINCIESLNLELASDLRKFLILNKKKLILIKSYRGLRRLRGLPIRGQRTHTNAKTAKYLK